MIEELLQQTLNAENKQEDEVFNAVKSELGIKNEPSAEVLDQIKVHTEERLKQNLPPTFRKYDYQTGRDAKRWFMYLTLYAREIEIKNGIGLDNPTAVPADPEEAERLQFAQKQKDEVGMKMLIEGDPWNVYSSSLYEAERAHLSEKGIYEPDPREVCGHVNRLMTQVPGLIDGMQTGQLKPAQLEEIRAMIRQSS